MERIDDRLLLDPGVRRPGARIRVGFARGIDERREAQRLRWQVFADELGARLPSRERGIDHDFFDPYCEHLVAREDESGAVIGTYRLLSPRAARRLGCYYSETQFDLTRLQALRDELVEVGRSCIHPAWRNGGVIAALWSALGRYMRTSGHRYLAGCASTSMADGGHAAAALNARLRERHLAPVEYQVRARMPLPIDRLDAGVVAEMPPLLKGYLRMGAWIGGEPSWDPDFNTADFFILLPVARVEPRYARHFFGGPSGQRANH